MGNYARGRTGYNRNDDYYTPRWIFAALNAKFDLDVCAPTGGVEWIPADNYYDIEADALKQQWYGFVWCNPPYSDASPFINKFIDHGNGIMLVQLSKSKGFMRLWNEADAMCMLPRDIKFEHKDNGRKDIFMPVGLFAMGTKAKMHLELSGINKVR